MAQLLGSLGQGQRQRSEAGFDGAVVGGENGGNLTAPIQTRQ